MKWPVLQNQLGADDKHKKNINNHVGFKYLPAIPAMASDAKYFTSTSLSTFSLSNTGLTCVCMQL
jgi:hypothetical protein